MNVLSVDASRTHGCTGLVDAGGVDRSRSGQRYTLDSDPREGSTVFIVNEGMSDELQIGLVAELVGLSVPGQREVRPPNLRKSRSASVGAMAAARS